MKKLIAVAVAAGFVVAASPAVAHKPQFKERPALAGWPANWKMTVKTPYCNPKVQVGAICAGGATIWSTNGKPAPATLIVCYGLSTTRNGPYAAGYGCQSFGSGDAVPVVKYTRVDGQSAQFQLQHCVWSETEGEGEVKISGTWRFKSVESVPIHSCGGVASGT